MKIQKANLILAFLIIFSQAFGQSRDEDWSKIDQTDYFLSYPASWILDHSGQMGTKFILFVGNKEHEFRTNLNLVVQNIKGLGYDLDKFVALSEGQVKTIITNVRILESKRVKSEANEFQEVIFTGDQGIFHLTWKQRYWVIGDKAFVLTFTDSEAMYHEHEQSMNKVIDSFKLK